MAYRDFREERAAEMLEKYASTTPVKQWEDRVTDKVLDHVSTLHNSRWRMWVAGVLWFVAGFIVGAIANVV